MLRTFWKEDPGQLAIDFLLGSGMSQGPRRLPGARVMG